MTSMKEMEKSNKGQGRELQDKIGLKTRSYQEKQRQFKKLTLGTVTVQ